VELLEALLVGVIQGITEWLPISSEGITSLVMLNLFSRPFSEAIPISIWLHTGTLLAATLYFRSEIMAIFGNLPRYNLKGGTEIDLLTGFIVVSTISTIGIGTPLFLFAVGRLNISGEIATALIGMLLIFTGIFQRYSKTRLGKRTNASIVDGALVGGVQALSVFPGLSRSGLTISALLLRGYTAKYALKLSFLMSIPAVLGAEVGMLLLKNIEINFNMAISMTAAFLVGYLTIKTLIGVTERVDFGSFCILLGMLSMLSLIA
jgi:undecaprenyl-diphosphatase